MLRGRRSKDWSLTRSTHWSETLHEIRLRLGPDGLLFLTVLGGAENGRFCWIGDVQPERLTVVSGKLRPNEIVLEVQGRKVSGFTLYDLVALLRTLNRDDVEITLKTVRSGLLIILHNYFNFDMV